MYTVDIYGGIRCDNEDEVMLLVDLLTAERRAEEARHREEIRRMWQRQDFALVSPMHQPVFVD